MPLQQILIPSLICKAGSRILVNGALGISSLQKKTDALLKFPSIEWHMPILRRTVAVKIAKSPIYAALR
jgi:hypothetical protein